MKHYSQRLTHRETATISAPPPTNPTNVVIRGIPSPGDDRSTHEWQIDNIVMGASGQLLKDLLTVDIALLFVSGQTVKDIPPAAVSVVNTTYVDFLFSNYPDADILAVATKFSYLANMSFHPFALNPEHHIGALWGVNIGTASFLDFEYTISYRLLDRIGTQV